MKSMVSIRVPKKIILFIGLISVSLISCENFIEIPLPRSDLTRSTVFSNGETAQAALFDIYYRMSQAGFVSGTQIGVSFLTALSSDELVNYDLTTYSGQFEQFYQNAITQNSALVELLWSDPYTYIYRANAILESIANSEGITDDVKRQLEGEAKFVRAFSHFYLVNLFGDIPLVLTSDYRINAKLPRASVDEVYLQIVSDLKAAQALLPDDYEFSNYERTRPNRLAATALLARVYLYLGDWANCEIESTKLLEQASVVSLSEDLSEVFLKNSNEAIWQIGSDYDNPPTLMFTIPSPGGLPPSSALSPGLIQEFEVGDMRKDIWTGAVTNGVDTFYYAAKYKAAGSEEIKEYYVVLRLAEQYLIRAEARARLDNVPGAIADLDVVRGRAGLPLIADTNPSISAEDLLTLIEKERRVELFTEWGHRWFDLKRTGRIDAVLDPIKSDWQPADALYPIPEIQLLNSGGIMTQNPGY
ncbi:MAG TPA: RagB/SusD family nutrient uptake outer membrane protein [Cyclobacteriaceae bacterium]